MEKHWRQRCERKVTKLPKDDIGLLTKIISIAKVKCYCRDSAYMFTCSETMGKIIGGLHFLNGQTSQRSTGTLLVCPSPNVILLWIVYHGSIGYPDAFLSIVYQLPTPWCSLWDEQSFSV